MGPACATILRMCILYIPEIPPGHILVRARYLLLAGLCNLGAIYQTGLPEDFRQHLADAGCMFLSDSSECHHNFVCVKLSLCCCPNQFMGKGKEVCSLDASDCGPDITCHNLLQTCLHSQWQFKITQVKDLARGCLKRYMHM